MMESWSYGSEGKGLLFSDEIDLSVESFLRSRKTWMGWESKPSYNFYINKVISDNDATENMEFMDPAFTELTRKPSCLVTSNSFCKEEKSGSKISNSCMESISQDSTLIDLNLGRLVDCRNAQSGKFLKERSIVSSARPSLTAKKVRPTSSCSQTPLCQVYGCNKDLSSSKDYHKRHKVCEVHSKTPKVIVNGNEQRFCQQCSRFHLLAEFDDGKRSCRRRLAGHNERRRKPRFNILSDKSRTEFAWTSIPQGASFAFPDMVPGGILFPERYEEANQCKRLKFSEKLFYSPQLVEPITNEELLMKSFLYQGNKKQHSLGIPPSATESYNVLNAASTRQESSGFSHSSCALSLLSAPSLILPSHSTGILRAKPLFNQVSCVHDNLDQNFDKTSCVISSQKYARKGFYLSGINSIDSSHSWSSMIPDASHAVGLKIETDRFSQESDLFNDKYSLSPEHGSTVDLIQLSSHLKRVEQQRNFMQPKLHNDDI